MDFEHAFNGVLKYRVIQVVYTIRGFRKLLKPVDGGIVVRAK